MAAVEEPASAGGVGSPQTGLAVVDVSTYTSGMTSIEVADATAALLRSQAARAGVSVDAYIRRLALLESVRRHADVLDEQFYADAEAERLAG